MSKSIDDKIDDHNPPLTKFQMMMAIKKLFVDGKNRNVEDVKSELRSLGYQFPNERVGEVLTEMDGVFVTRTGDVKGSTKYFELISKEKFNTSLAKQVLKDAQMESAQVDAMSMEMMAFSRMMMDYSKNFYNKSEPEQRQMERDIALFSQVATRQLDSVRGSTDKNQEEKNRRTDLILMTDLFKRTIGVHQNDFPNIKEYKKEYEQMESSKLNFKFTELFDRICPEFKKI